MKKSDLAMIILIVAISLTVSWIVGSIFIRTPESRSTKVEVVEPVSSDFPVPSSEVFVSDYINPTELIQIGDTTNNQPFNNSSN